MKKKKSMIPDIDELAELFIQTLRKTKESGNRLNRNTLAQFLVKNQEIMDLLRLARGAQNGIAGSQQEQEITPPLVENHKREVDDTDHLERQLAEERDFADRLSLFLLNLGRVPGNERFFPFLDRYRQLVAEDADLEDRKWLFTEKFETLESGDSTVKPEGAAPEGETPDVSTHGPEAVPTPDMFREMLKAALLRALDELRHILGDKSHHLIETLAAEVRESDDIDTLLTKCGEVIGLVEYYITQVNSERMLVADFMKDIGKKLLEMEGDLVTAFSSTGQMLQDDTVFTMQLGEDIRAFGDTVRQSSDLTELKNAITSQITTLTRKIEEKKQDYDTRLEQLSQEKENIKKRLQVMVDRVVDQNKMLVEQSQKDQLTGILNRGTFENSFDIELQRFRRYREPFALIMFDIDHFKEVNDTYGHVAGDKVLVGIAKGISRMLRATDVFARFGGEEFIIMMPYADLDHGLVVAEKIRKTVEVTQFIYEEATVPVTVSVGLTVVTPEDEDFKSMYTRVDRLLYRAKNEGRNRVVSDADEDH